MKCFPDDQTEFKGNTIANRQLPVKIAISFQSTRKDSGKSKITIKPAAYK